MQNLKKLKSSNLLHISSFIITSTFFYYKIVMKVIFLKIFDLTPWFSIFWKGKCVFEKFIEILSHCQKMKISGEDFGFYIIVFLITLSLFYNLFASTLILRMWRLYRNIYLWLQLCYLYPLSRCQIIVISDNMAKSFGLKISKISNWTSII